MTYQTLATILSHITLPQGWGIEIHEKGDGFLIQIVFTAQDTQSGEMKEQRCRKWYVSSHSTTTEVVRTVYKAGIAALEHEFDETFTYKGVALFNPHASVDAQVEGETPSHVLDVRTDAINEEWGV